MKQVRVLDYETGKRPSGHSVWIHKDDFPWFVRYACEDIARGRGLPWSEDREPDTRNRLLYNSGTATWQCVWWNAESQLMQTIERRVPRRKKHHGAARPLPPLQF